MPTSPFLPLVPRASASRSHISRRTPATGKAQGQGHERAVFPGAPFGEKGREHDTDELELVSIASGGSREDLDPETAAFQPRVRDLQAKRPIVRRKAARDTATKQQGSPTWKAESVEGSSSSPPSLAESSSVAGMADEGPQPAGRLDSCAEEKAGSRSGTFEQAEKRYIDHLGADRAVVQR